MQIWNGYYMTRTAMEEFNQKAWDILSKEEQVSLSLSKGHQKSSWQAGEIMNKSHYKYLEINNRAEHFLKIFTEHFNKYHDDLIPPTIGGMHEDFVKFFEQSIFKRKKKTEIANKYPDSMLFIPKSRDRVIREGFEILKEGKTQAHKDVLYALTEFDRWNNFRILPEQIQEPSAYKRRNKARNRKHLQRLLTLPELTLDLVIDRFKYTKKGAKLFLPIISEHIQDNYEVITMKNNELEIEAASKMGYYVFTDADDADIYGFKVAEYIAEGSKSCKSGQKFWKEFRELIESSENWKQVNNIIPKRKYIENIEETLNLSNMKDKAKKKLSNKKAKKQPAIKRMKVK